MGTKLLIGDKARKQIETARGAVYETIRELRKDADYSRDKDCLIADLKNMVDTFNELLDL